MADNSAQTNGANGHNEDTMMMDADAEPPQLLRPEPELLTPQHEPLMETQPEEEAQPQTDPQPTNGHIAHDESLTEPVPTEPSQTQPTPTVAYTPRDILPAPPPPIPTSQPQAQPQNPPTNSHPPQTNATMPAKHAEAPKDNGVPSPARGSTPMFGMAIPETQEHGSPTRVYLNTKVGPVLLEGMKWLAKHEPEKPLKWLSEFLAARSKDLEGE